MEIAGYTDLVEVGRGGYAVVYKAHQARFGRTVALKVLTNPGFGEIDRARFEREALAMGRLSWHPNIVVVHDTGTTDHGLPYLVEEYVEGGSLGDQLESGPLDPARAVADMVQLCAAVHTAHQADLLHRDIKPDNALVDSLGRIKLADFGIAGVAGSNLTTTGTVTATIAHAAPEVLNGERATIAADVYSLGSTLYELLTGAAAFVRDTDESVVPLVVRVTTEPVPDLRGAGIPEPVVEAVEAAMAKDPHDRPATALALGQQLQQAQQQLGQPVTELAVLGGAAAPAPAPAAPVAAAAAAVTSAQHTPSPATTGETVSVPAGATPPPGQERSTPADDGAGRSKLPLVVAGLVALAVVVGLVVALSGGDDDPEEAAEPGPATTAAPPTSAPPATGGEGPRDTVLPTGTRPFRIAAVGDTIWVTNADDGAVSRIDAASGEITESIDIGGEVIGVDADEAAAWVVDTTGAAVVRIDAETGDTSRTAVGTQPRIVDVTDDGVWVSNVGADSVTRVDPDSGEAVTTIAVGGDPRGLTATDDDVWVMNYADGSISRIDPGTDEVVAVIPVGGTPVSALMVDGVLWVADPGTDTMILLDADSQAEQDRFRVGDGPNGMALAGTDLYVSIAGDDEVIRIDTTTAEVVETIPVGDGPAGLAVTEDHLWVANTLDGTVSRIALG